VLNATAPRSGPPPTQHTVVRSLSTCNNANQMLTKWATWCFSALRTACSVQYCTVLYNTVYAVLDLYLAHVLPPTGTTRLEKLEETFGAVGLSLSSEDMEQIGKAVPEAEVVGGRYPEAMMSTTWVHANTPPWSPGSQKSEGGQGSSFHHTALRHQDFPATVLLPSRCWLGNGQRYQDKNSSLYRHCTVPVLSMYWSCHCAQHAAQCYL